MDKSIQTEISEEMHIQIVTSLPLYVNGTLADAEYQHVKAHLAECKTCRQEIETLQKLGAAIQQQGNKTDWQPGPAHLQSIFNKIDASEQTSTQAKENSESIWQSMRNGFRAFLEAPAALRWTFAAQSALVVILSVVLVAWIPDASQTNFQTYSSEKLPPNTDNPHVRIVFSETMQLNELSSLLTDIPATVVEGPSPLGVFTIQLNSDHADLTEILSTLRQNEHVDFAEIID